MKALFMVGSLILSHATLADIIDVRVFTPFSTTVFQPPQERGKLFSSDGETITFKECYPQKEPVKAKESCHGYEYILGKKDKVYADLLKKLSADRKPEKAKQIADEVFRMLEKGNQRLVEKNSVLKAEPALSGVSEAELKEATKLFLGYKVVFPDKWNDGKLVFDSFGNCKPRLRCSPPAPGVNYDHCLKLPTSEQRNKCIDRAIANANPKNDVSDRVLRNQTCHIDLETGNPAKPGKSFHRKFKDNFFDEVPEDGIFESAIQRCFTRVKELKPVAKKVNNSERAPKEVFEKSDSQTNAEESGSRQ